MNEGKELLLAPVEFGEKWGYVDKTGNIVIEPRFVRAGHFFKGLAKVVSIIGDGKGGRYIAFGYIDKTGKYVAEPRFDDAGDFSEGLAKVKMGGKRSYRYGYIDKTGKVVIEPQFDHAGVFK